MCLHKKGEFIGFTGPGFGHGKGFGSGAQKLDTSDQNRHDDQTVIDPYEGSSFILMGNKRKKLI